MSKRRLVQYQRYEYEQTGLAPYPIKYNRPHDRVTDERAPVTILRPESSLFQLPNLISSSDFEGWIHDRGLYFLNKWDDNYWSDYKDIFGFPKIIKGKFRISNIFFEFDLPWFNFDWNPAKEPYDI